MIETTIADGCVKVECDGKTIARCDGEADADRIKRALERESMVVVWFEATPEQDKTIEDVLDVADVHFAATEPTRTDTLVAVLKEWQQRVVDEESAKIAAHLEKVDENGPPGLEDPRTQMHFRLDEDDLRDIGEAVARLKALDCEPDDSDSCELGGMLAEICRGWMERVEHDQREYEANCKAAKWTTEANDAKPTRTDNGDGTVTFHGVPVTVRADVLEGRDVLAVRRPKPGEDVLGTDGFIVPITNEWTKDYAGVRAILGPKPQPPAPTQVFRESGFYLTRGGILAGPLEHNSNTKTANTYPWQCNVRGQRRTYTTTGTVWEEAACDDDLLPGEVIVWRHPGLKAGVYLWDGIGMSLRGQAGYMTCNWAVNVFADWTDPPRVGKWKVVDGQEYATWEGE